MITKWRFAPLLRPLTVCGQERPLCPEKSLQKTHMSDSTPTRARRLWCSGAFMKTNFVKCGGTCAVGLGNALQRGLVYHSHTLYRFFPIFRSPDENGSLLWYSSCLAVSLLQYLNDMHKKVQMPWLTCRKFALSHISVAVYFIQTNFCLCKVRASRITML